MNKNTVQEPPKRQLSQQEKFDWLRLSLSENVGPITFFKLLERFSSAKAALEELPTLAKLGGKTKKIKLFSKKNTEKIIHFCEQNNIHIEAFPEEHYPTLLRYIEDAPPLLFVRGKKHLLTKKSVAIVGARNASINGQKITHDITKNLGEAGFLTVSGMARGIDTAAHNAAINKGTAAVLAGGVDIVYPSENQDLYEEILHIGVAFSESPPKTQPIARHFPRRNRLISGMCRGIIIIEASIKSGSLITAKMALEQGREVFSVPGSPLDPRAKGTNMLIKEGAILAEDAGDILPTLNKLHHSPIADRIISYQLDSSLHISPHETEIARNTIIEKLSPIPTSMNELLNQSSFSPALISLVLLELELAGKLQRHPGDKVSLIGSLQ